MNRLKILNSANSKFLKTSNFMLKTLLLSLTTAVAIFAADTILEPNINNQLASDSTEAALIDPHRITSIDEDQLSPNLITRSIEEFTVTLDKRATNILWSIDETTNRLDMATFTQVDTNWFPIEKGTNVPPAAKPGDIGVKEIGEIQTNRYLTIVYYGKTNKFLMGLVAKEPWPTQKRNRLEPKPPGQPQPARR